MKKALLSIIIICITLIAVYHKQLFNTFPSKNEITLTAYPIDSLDGLITQNNIEIDNAISKDGKGSLKITANEPTVINLYETGDIDVEDAQILYQATLRTENVTGQVYLEMWCSMPNMGEFFSRALHAPLSGNNDWTMQQTSFLLQKGQNPDNIKLNLVINGTGTVWIDDIKLVKH